MRRENFVVHCKEMYWYWRASRVPAAAVIPAPIVSMVNAAVKKSVVLIVNDAFGVVKDMFCDACGKRGLWMYSK